MTKIYYDDLIWFNQLTNLIRAAVLGHFQDKGFSSVRFDIDEEKVVAGLPKPREMTILVNRGSAVFEIKMSAWVEE